MNVYNWFCFVTAFCTVRGGKQTPIVFPGPADTDRIPKGIPLELAKQMNEYNDVTALIDDFFPSEQNLPIISARFGSSPERKALRLAKLAACQPEMQIIPLQPAEESTTFYIPSCTRVKRCSGCCSHELLSCQPVESEILQLGVIVSQYYGGDKLNKKRREIVSVEQHTKCKCDCRIKPADCNPYQKYSADSCRCLCTNRDKEEKCSEEIEEKLWDPNECACVCRELKECSTGHYYDKYTCKCLKEREWRNNGTRDFDRFSYNIDPF